MLFLWKLRKHLEEKRQENETKRKCDKSESLYVCVVIFFIPINFMCFDQFLSWIGTFTDDAII